MASLREMRRDNDFYPTPAWATEILLERLDRNLGKVLEPCAGAGHISNTIARSGRADFVTTNDIDLSMPTASHLDATKPEFWHPLEVVGFDWIISNPPFDVALPIVRNAVEYRLRGAAMLLRLSFLEPTIERGPWLAENPPDRTIVIPRISFTGDGKTDNVTCAWFIWDNYQCNGQRLEIVPRRAPQEAML